MGGGVVFRAREESRRLPILYSILFYFPPRGTLYGAARRAGVTPHAAGLSMPCRMLYASTNRSAAKHRAARRR